ncbi:MAG: C1 family peptidase [Flavobacteriales bacterium]
MAALVTFVSVYAQDDLIRKVAANQSDTNGFHFTTVVSTEVTPVENQASSGTCWSYSANSFLESEMIKKGGPAVHLSKMYTARMAYEAKAENYVRMHGAVSWGDGGEPHDVVNMLAAHGTMPEETYKGLNYGTTKNQFAEMQAVLKAMLEAIVKAPNGGKLTTAWKQAFSGVLDAYLGAVPANFTYNGKNYTPQSFAKEVTKLDPNDYVEFISVNNAPYWQKTMMMIPDNWAFQHDWNIPMEEITNVIDHALRNGYSISWGGDVSEPSFSWKNGVAYVAALDAGDITKDQKAGLFKGPRAEPTITPELRQAAFDNYTTSDDHGMQITGIAKDQLGNEWYMVKNSWGTENDFQGYLYMSKAYVQYKTTGFMVNKKGVPSSVLKRIGM